MESFQGLAILTTNVKSTLERRFQRRLRLLSMFRFPEGAIGGLGRALPSGEPTSGLDPESGWQPDMAGGAYTTCMECWFLAAV